MEEQSCRMRSLDILTFSR